MSGASLGQLGAIVVHLIERVATPATSASMASSAPLPAARSRS
jgi:hypothetical protein